MSKTIAFQYRDGANYKWDFNAKISDEKFKELEKMYGEIKEGSEITYDVDLYINQDEFFNERGYDFDDSIDHNIIEVQKILTEEEAQNEPVTFYIDCDENS
jgi:hypothetical protein